MLFNLEQDVLGIKHRRRRRGIAKEVAKDPYDPRKPEYIIPTSDAEYQALTLDVRDRLASKLEKAAAARGSTGVPDRYLEVAQDLRKGNFVPGVPCLGLTARKEPQQCPICLEGPARGAILITLACGHALCSNCSAKCAVAGLNHCPVCRFPHILDPECLAKRREQWRSQYGQWRLGAASGAHGEASDIHEPVCESLLGARASLPKAIQAIPLHELMGRKRGDSLEAMLSRLLAHPVLTTNRAGDIILRTMEDKLSVQKNPSEKWGTDSASHRPKFGTGHLRGILGCVSAAASFVGLQCVSP
mmetsp:Transcript_32828/g.60064  ORF Transcript_32828/g.60064 Transcript_32828/m.60064 type:complete len:302 (-) Transcript_32828:76-981(-)